MAKPTAAAVFEDKYLRLRDDSELLKKQNNEQADVIKKLRTKLTIVEESLRRAGVGDTGAKYIEAQETIAAQSMELDRLRRKVKSLETKLRRTEEELHRKPRLGGGTGARRSGAGSISRRALESRGSSAPRARRSLASSVGGGDGGGEEARALVRKMEDRIATLERRLRESQAEVRDLQSRGVGGMMTMDSRGYGSDRMESKQGSPSEDAEVALLRARYARLESHLTARAALHDKVTAAFEQQAVTLRDREAALQRAEAENAALRGRVESLRESEVRKDALETEVRELEAKLEDVLSSPFFGGGSNSNGMTAREAEKEIKRLRAALEAAKESQREAESNLRIIEPQLAAAKEDRDEARDEAKRLRERLESAVRGTDALRAHVALYAGVDGAEADAEGAVPLQDLEDALAIVRRRRDHPQRVGFLDGDDGNGKKPSKGEEEVDDGAQMRKKLRETRASLLDAQQARERAERLVRTARGYTTDLETEIADLRTKLRTETSALTRRTRALDQVARRKEDAIRVLRGQVDALLAEQRRWRSSNRRTPTTNSHSHSDPHSETETTKKHQSSTEPDPDTDFLDNDLLARAGETAVEVRINGAKLIRDAADATAQGPTFCVVDFFDFESQASSLVGGETPNYSLSSIFPCAADDSLLRTCAAQGCDVEICVAAGGDARVVASGSVPIHRLLFAPARPRNARDAAAPEHGRWSGEIPLRGADGVTRVGWLAVEVRATVPLGPAWRRFVDVEPEPAAALFSLAHERDADADKLENDDVVDGGKVGASQVKTSEDQDDAILQRSLLESSAANAGVSNRVVVEVLGIESAESAENGDTDKMTSDDGELHVQYKFPTWSQTAVTAPSGPDAIVQDVRPFPHNTDSTSLSTLRGQTLELFVCTSSSPGAPSGAIASWTDVGVAGSSKSSVSHPAGVLGSSVVALAPLAEGRPIHSAFPIRGTSLKVRVRIAWERPLVPTDGLAPATVRLSSLESFLSRFSSSSSSASASSSSSALEWPLAVAWIARADGAVEAAVSRMRQTLAAAEATESMLSTSLVRAARRQKTESSSSSSSSSSTEQNSVQAVDIAEAVASAAAWADAATRDDAHESATARTWTTPDATTLDDANTLTNFLSSISTSTSTSTTTTSKPTSEETSSSSSALIRHVVALLRPHRMAEEAAAEHKIRSWARAALGPNESGIRSAVTAASREFPLESTTDGNCTVRAMTVALERSGLIVIRDRRSEEEEEKKKKKTERPIAGGDATISSGGGASKSRSSGVDASKSSGDETTKKSTGDEPAKKSTGDEPAKKSTGDEPAKKSSGDEPAKKSTTSENPKESEEIPRASAATMAKLRASVRLGRQRRARLGPADGCDAVGRWSRSVFGPVVEGEEGEEEEEEEVALDDLRRLVESGADEDGWLAKEEVEKALATDGGSWAEVCSAGVPSWARTPTKVDAESLLCVLGGEDLTVDDGVVAGVRGSLRRWMRSTGSTARACFAKLARAPHRDAVTAESLLELAVASGGGDDGSSDSVGEAVRRGMERCGVWTQDRRSSAAQTVVTAISLGSAADATQRVADLGAFVAWIHGADAATWQYALCGRALSAAVRAEARATSNSTGSSASGSGPREDGVLFATDIFGTLDRRSAKDIRKDPKLEETLPAVDDATGLRGVVTHQRFGRALSSFLQSTTTADENTAIADRCVYSTSSSSAQDNAFVRYMGVATLMERAAAALRADARAVGRPLAADNPEGTAPPTPTTSASQPRPSLVRLALHIASSISSSSGKPLTRKLCTDIVRTSPSDLANFLAANTDIPESLWTEALSRFPTAPPHLARVQLASFLQGILQSRTDFVVDSPTDEKDDEKDDNNTASASTSPKKPDEKDSSPSKPEDQATSSSTPEKSKDEDKKKEETSPASDVHEAPLSARSDVPGSDDVWVPFEADEEGEGVVVCLLRVEDVRVGDRVRRRWSRSEEAKRRFRVGFEVEGLEEEGRHFVHVPYEGDLPKPDEDGTTPRITLPLPATLARRFPKLQPPTSVQWQVRAPGAPGGGEWVLAKGTSNLTEEGNLEEQTIELRDEVDRIAAKLTVKFASKKPTN